MKAVKTIIVILLFSGLIGCAQLNLDNSLVSDRSDELPVSAADNNNLAETTAPKIISRLKQNLPADSPQIKIVAPKAGQTLAQTDVEIKLAARDFAVFKNEQLALGNHVNLIIDNEPLQTVYDLEKPIIVNNLAPGTHSIRVLAVRPWGESIKTKEAYAQITFNVLTETQGNLPNPNYPLLTYNSPSGTYGAEPILLDFYLSDSNLGNGTNLEPYSVKATVNGTSFTVNNWQPYYLKGFKPGENWIQLELIDKSGNIVDNAFNSTVRVFNYNPQQEDALAQLLTKQISFDDARLLVNPDEDTQPEKPSEIAELQTIPLESEADDSQPQNVEESLTTPATLSYSDSQTEISKLDSSAESQAIAPFSEPTSEIPTLAEQNKIEIIDVATDSLDEPALSIIENPAESEVEESEAENAIAIDTAQKIVITKPDSSTNSVAEITIPQPESVEITESEIAITIPNSQTAPEPKPELRSPKATARWWKKILVSIRHGIEALAKQLPSEV